MQVDMKIEGLEELAREVQAAQRFLRAWDTPHGSSERSQACTQVRPTLTHPKQEGTLRRQIARQKRR